MQLSLSASAGTRVTQGEVHDGPKECRANSTTRMLARLSQM